MFSRTVEYALRAVIHLAHESPNPRTTAQIAEATRVPKDYLVKVLQGLAEKGVVKTQRGVGGGVSLARTPEELTILDVVNAVEPVGADRDVPAGPAEPRGEPLPAAPADGRGAGRGGGGVRASTLAEVLADPTTTSVPLCDGTGAAQTLKVRNARA